MNGACTGRAAHAKGEVSDADHEPSDAIDPCRRKRITAVEDFRAPESVEEEAQPDADFLS